MGHRYKIIDDFQAGDTDIRALVLDREYEFFPRAARWIAVIDGKEYPYRVNYGERCILIESHDSFTGKTVECV